jgi:O-6-methylguanine DNA methyltransferase
MITPFQKKIYEALKKVPKGKVTTYQDLAHTIGSKAYRAVGSAMRKNPFAPVVPCHRVINTDGSIGNFSGKDGVKGKIKMLREEGIIIINNKIDLKKFLYKK